MLTVTHYPELLDSHNLVLTRADTVNQAIVSVPEVHQRLSLFILLLLHFLLTSQNCSLISL